MIPRISLRQALADPALLGGVLEGVEAVAHVADRGDGPTGVRRGAAVA